MDNLNSLLPCPKTSSQKEYQKVKKKKIDLRRFLLSPAFRQSSSLLQPRNLTVSQLKIKEHRSLDLQSIIYII